MVVKVKRVNDNYGPDERVESQDWLHGLDGGWRLPDTVGGLLEMFAPEADDPESIVAAITMILGWPQTERAMPDGLRTAMETTRRELIEGMATDETEPA